MINKIFRQRMEDPEPLENQARGVPAAFAAVVRKLMSKKPEERHQTAPSCAATWRAGPTRPAFARSSVPKPTPPAASGRRPRNWSRKTSGCLDVDDPSPSRDGISLRDLGSAEPSMAPRHQAPMPPLPAIIRSAPSRESTTPTVPQLRPR